ncbi:hypothetical protein [Schlesneria sp.]|uniref:hypothetical protein n=1 Tax=Schlesneria sp. TaxID=2762018 RepID=UPI002F20B541
MASHGWIFWAAPLSLWAFYSCWYFGYQSGYADGHETAWNLSRPFEPQVELSQIDEESHTATPPFTPVTSLR